MAKKSVKTKSVKKKNSFNKKEFSLFMLAFAVVGIFTLWVSLAAPHKGGGGSLGVVMVADANSDGLPNFKDVVTFNISTAASFPYVRVNCSQNPTLVFSQTNGFFAAYPWGQNYTLGPTPSWSGGAADCTATLFSLSNSSKQTTLATTSFRVNP